MLTGFGLGLGGVTRRQGVGGSTAPGAFVPANPFIGWGSSTTAGNSDSSGVTVFTALQALIPGLSVTNKGLGGNTDAQIRTRVLAGTAGEKDDDTLLQHGGNGLDTFAEVATVKGNVDDEIAAIGHTRYVISETAWGRNGEAPGSMFAYANKLFYRAVAAAYPGKVISLREVAYSYAATDANDATDKAAGLLPRSMLIGDLSHFDRDGQEWWAVTMEKWLRGINGGIAFVPWQEIVAVAPATPAAGDSLGQLKFEEGGGSGTTFSLDPVSSDVAISSSGAITRVGATALDKDYYEVGARATKDGKYYAAPQKLRVSEKRRVTLAPARVKFDGNVWLTAEGAHLGNVTKFTIVFALQMDVDGVANRVFASSGPAAFDIDRQSTNNLRIILRNAAAATLLSVSAGVNAFNIAAGEKWVALSVDLSSGGSELCSFYLNDTAGPAPSTLTAGTIGAATQLFLGASTLTGTSRLNGSLRRLWMAHDYIDFSVTANRRLFYDAAFAPAALPADGKVTTAAAVDVTPVLDIEGNAADWYLGTNRGTGGQRYAAWQVDGGSGLGRFTTV